MLLEPVVSHLEFLRADLELIRPAHTLSRRNFTAKITDICLHAILLRCWSFQLIVTLLSLRTLLVGHSIEHECFGLISITFESLSEALRVVVKTVCEGT